jgi:exportin-T
VAASKPEKGIPRVVIDYSQYELTAQGRMMISMITSNVVSYPHPAVPMQVFESAVRYPDFFKVRKEAVAPILEAIIDTRYILHTFLIPADFAI